MEKQLTQRKPRYFFALFGDPTAGKPKVETGSYPHKGYISSLNMIPGDVMLLYCAGSYHTHFMEAPGIGIVLDTTEDCVSYQYFPLDQPVGWDTIKESLKKYTNRLQVLLTKGNWLWEIDDSAAFRDVVKGRQIDWP